MAYYDKVKKGPKTSERNNERWEEEGSRYRGEYAPIRSSSGRSDSDERFGRREKKYNGAGEHRPRSRDSYSAYDRNDRRPARDGGDAYKGNRYSDHRSKEYAGGDEQKPFDSRRPKGRNGYTEKRSYDRRPSENGRPAWREDAQPEKSYRDFEHVPQVPPRDENLPVDNLLVGRNPIREAIKSGRDLEKLLVARGELQGSAREILQMAKDAHVVIQEVDKTRLDEIAPHHQGMIAYASAYQYSSVRDMLDEAMNKGEDPFLVILDGVTDPHNLGAVIRSAECAGAHGVIVPERRSVGLTPAAVKASAGAIEHMKVARVSNLNRTLEELKKLGVWIYALTMDGKDYQKIDFRGPCALVIGSEGEGISRLVLENSDVQVSLPMKGHIDSLNASVAAGIVMYRVLEARRR